MKDGLGRIPIGCGSIVAVIGAIVGLLTSDVDSVGLGAVLFSGVILGVIALVISGIIVWVIRGVRNRK